MKTTLALIAAATLGLSFAGATVPAQAQKIDAKGNCHDASGKLAKMEVCKPPAAAAGARCKDAKTGKFASCKAAGAVAVKPKG